MQAQGSESLVDGSDIFDETLHPSRHIHAPSRRSLTQSEADAPTAAIPPGTDNDVGASARDSDLRGTTIRSPNTTNASDYGIFIWISVGIAAWFLYHGFKRNGHCRPREHSNNNMRYPTSEQLPVGGVLSVPGRGYWAPGGPGRQAVALVHLQEQRPSRSRRGGPHRTRSARDRVVCCLILLYCAKMLCFLVGVVQAPSSAASCSAYCSFAQAYSCHSPHPGLCFCANVSTSRICAGCSTCMSLDV